MSAARTEIENRAPVHAQLRAATRDQHARIESELDLLSENLSPERYRAVLGAFLGFYAPLEERLTARVSALASTVPFPLLERAPALRDDLIALGVPEQEVGAIPRCPYIPAVETVPQLAGCLYVVEGASLGGRIVARAVSRRFGYRAENGARFFAFSSPRTRWPEVLAWLETAAERDFEREEAIAAARATFDALSRWARSKIDSA